ncbi:Zinc finger CCCH domain-containing protein 16 [Morella rubra]|uniref:Zinc finger CCCH domain-containing protein 16 n=1 Tax=Morella rubra TaxID=262757 RepID=A0A6A1UX06_9ROSI|nr:Zinc finger CCCH domain-containing protein 16 [Morella rubra]
MQFTKEPCRNFQRGHCRFGERCRYLHVTQQQPKASFFGTQIGSNQQQKPNAFGFGAQTVSYQQQKPNPFGFGVQNSSQSKGATDFGSKLNQSKLSQNTWTRSTSTPTGGASQLPDNQTQATNHKCTDPEACRRQIVEDFECERPLWKLTCYSHSKDAPCDIVGDVSYEELRTAAYDDARRGLSFQSIIERERNLLNSKLVEFDNLLNKLYAVVPNSTPANQIPSSGARPSAVPLTAHNSAPPSVSSFSQLGASQNMGVGIRPSTPSNNALRQLNPNPNSSLTSSTFGMNNFQYRSEGAVTSQMPSQTPGSSFTSNVAGFSNSGDINSRSNTFSSPTGPAQISSSTSNNSSIISNGPNFHVTGSESTDVQLMTNLQMVHVSGNLSIWLKEKWNPGEIPEEAPPDEFV